MAPPLGLMARNILRNRRRSLLTVLSIAISICLLGVMLSLYRSFFLEPPAELQSLRLITVNRVSITNVLPISYRERIRQVPGVEEVTVMQWYGGTYKDNRDIANIFARFAIEPAKLFRIFPEFRVDPEQKKAFLADRRGCLVGRPLAERLGLKVGDRVHVQGDLYPVDLDLIVRGIYSSPRDSQNLYFDNAYLEEGAPNFKNFAMLYVLRVRPGHDLQAVARAIDEQFRNSLAETKTDTERAFEAGFLSYLGNVKLFIAALGGALTFTILLVAANTMAMSARERVREVAILRTLGYSRGALFGLLAGEGVGLALCGGALGTLLARMICLWLKTLPSLMVNLGGAQVTAGVAAACLGASAAIGLASSAVPAWGAARRPITQALRFVD
jgi:putative ABC transport system permease protein